MKIIPKKSKNIIELPTDEVLSALDGADGMKLKVLLTVMADPEFDADELCEKLDITKKRLDATLAFWEEHGVLSRQSRAARTAAAKSDKPKKENSNVSVHRALTRSAELPRYTSDELADFIENNSRMESLLINCQNCVGKVFSTAEVEVVVGLADYLKLDDDYILLLFAHCVKMGKKSLRYIEKLAVSLYDDGILGYDELDAHLTAIEEAFKMEHQLRSLFGIGKRALTKKEKSAFECWVGKWKMPFALIERAFEITVENTAGASVPYCSAVLEKWYTNGYTTVEEVDAAIQEYKHDKENAKDKKGSFETEDFFEAALKRSYGESSGENGGKG